MIPQAITLHTVKSLSIAGIVIVVILAVILGLLSKARTSRIVTIVVAVVVIIVLSTQVHQVDHHYKQCDGLGMSIIGIHYRVNPYCKIN